MKNKFKLVAALGIVCGALTFTGCTDFADDINALDDRLTAVENTLSSLQSQIESGAVIQSITSSENGVTITLTNGETYTITNGEDGTPGTVIEISEDGYWVIDGVKTDWRAYGADGQDGQDGKDGADGADGVDGQNGKDGADGQDANTVYYYPGDDYYWHKVTYSPDGTLISDEVTDIDWRGSYNGVTAIYDSVNGTLTFYGVDGSDEAIVISLWSQLKSLAFVPEVMAQGLGVIEFYSIMDADGDFVATNSPVVTYRMNPSNADISSVDFSFINRDVTTRVSGDETNLISIVGEPVSDGEGGLLFTVSANDSDALPADATVTGKQVMVALRAVSSKTSEEIVSDYAFVQAKDLVDFSIIDYDKYYADPSSVVAFSVTLPELTDEADFPLLYSDELDIRAAVETYASEVPAALPEIFVTPEYEFELVEYYGADGVTDQSKYVRIDDGVLSVDKSLLPESDGRAAVGRTPVVRVTAYVDGVEIAECYIKVEVVETEEPEQSIPEKTYITVEAEIEYTEIDPDNGEVFPVSWTMLNEQVLDALNMSYSEFTAAYNVNDVVVTYKVETAGDFGTTAPAGISYDASGDFDPTSTNAVSIVITNAVDENTYGTVKVVIPSYNDKLNGDVAIEFNYSVSHEHVWPAFNPDYLKPNTTNTVQVKGKLVNGAWEMQSSMKEHFEDYLADYENANNHVDLKFAIQPLVNGVPVKIGETAANAVAQEGAEITGSNYEDQEIALNAPLEGTKTYIVTAYTELANGNYCEMTYNVEFISPFAVTASDFSLKTLTAGTSSEDVKSHVVVSDLDGNVIYSDGAATAYATSTYMLSSSDFTFTYGLLFNEDDSAYDTEVSFGGGLTIDDDGVVSWSNDGTTLQKDKLAGYSVEVAVSTICVVEDTGTITVLSSANSK